jgi:hypothetical protein
MIDDKQTIYPRTNKDYHQARRDNEDRVDALLAECEKMEDELRSKPNKHEKDIKQRKIVFNYEHELNRIDCPRDDVGQWLEKQAQEINYKETGEAWHTTQTRLWMQEDGTHLFFVTLQPYFQTITQ